MEHLHCDSFGQQPDFLTPALTFHPAPLSPLMAAAVIFVLSLLLGLYCFIVWRRRATIHGYTADSKNLVARLQDKMFGEIGPEPVIDYLEAQKSLKRRNESMDDAMEKHKAVEGTRNVVVGIPVETDIDPQQPHAQAPSKPLKEVRSPVLLNDADEWSFGCYSAAEADVLTKPCCNPIAGV